MIDPKYRRHLTPQIGDIFHRMLQEGDYVLANRQPTLWRSSIQAMKVKQIPKGRTIRLNVDVTVPFNADFDGDEMCVFVPQNIDSRGELHTLMATKKHILIGGVGIVQDAALCLWILTHENPILGKSLFFDCLMCLQHFDLQQVHVYDGRSLIEQLLPDDLVIKVPKSEIGVCMLKGLSGATTVSSTAHIAHKLGLKVFATGGIGGVHRGYSNTLDMSQDLNTIKNTTLVVAVSYTHLTLPTKA